MHRNVLSNAAFRQCLDGDVDVAIAGVCRCGVLCLSQSGLVCWAAAMAPAAAAAVAVLTSPFDISADGAPVTTQSAVHDHPHRIVLCQRAAVRLTPVKPGFQPTQREGRNEPWFLPSWKMERVMEKSWNFNHLFSEKNS